MATTSSNGPPKGGDPGGRKAEGRLAGIFKRNPAAAVGAAGVGAVVIIALMMRNRGSSAQDAGGVSSSDLQKFGGISGLYDTTANDVYNSIASQLQAMQDAIANLKDGTTTTPAPKPAPKPKPKPKGKRAPTPKPRRKPAPKPPAKRYITIRRGDTLREIAKKNHITMTTLRNLNPAFWSNPKYRHGNLIFSGGRVRVK